MKKSILFIALAITLVFTMTAGVFAASEDLATEAQGKTTLIDKVNLDSIVGTGSFANEGAENLFDDDPATKFCTNVFPVEVTWQLDGAYVVDGVVICTANDNAQYTGRNPATWILSGSTDGTNYKKIHEGTASDLEDANFTYYLINISNDKAYQYYKLEIPSAEAAEVMQISEFILTGSAAPAAVDEPAEEPAEEPVVADEPVVTPPAPQTADVLTVSVISMALAGAAAIISKKRRS